MRDQRSEKATVGGLRLTGLVWAALCVPALAQEAIYRCGQVYTNAPRLASECERLSSQAITIVPGTRPSAVEPAALRVRATEATDPKGERTKVALTRWPQASQNERDAQARTIVAQELDKARQLLAQLQAEYQQGEPVKWASEARHHQKYLDRVEALKASIQRTERDIESLQRELARRPVMANTEKP